MTIISDASPLVALAKINQFGLLEKLFGHLVITPEVYGEVVVSGTGLPGSEATSKAAWIEVQPIGNPESLRSAQTRFALALGELSTLVLGKEMGADLLLLDDLAARKLAQREGFRVQGTIRIWKLAMPENIWWICVRLLCNFWFREFILIAPFSIRGSVCFSSAFVECLAKNGSSP